LKCNDEVSTFAWYQTTSYSANTITGSQDAAGLTAVDPQITAEAIDVTVTVRIEALDANVLVLSEAYASGETTAAYRYYYLDGNLNERSGTPTVNNYTPAKVYKLYVTAQTDNQYMTQAQVAAAIKAAGIKVTMSVASATNSQISDSRVKVWASGSAQTNANTDGYSVANSTLSDVANRHIANLTIPNDWTGTETLAGYFTVQVDGNNVDNETNNVADTVTALPTITATVSKLSA